MEKQDNMEDVGRPQYVKISVRVSWTAENIDVNVNVMQEIAILVEGKFSKNVAVKIRKKNGSNVKLALTHSFRVKIPVENHWAVETINVAKFVMILKKIVKFVIGVRK